MVLQIRLRSFYIFCARVLLSKYPQLPPKLQNSANQKETADKMPLTSDPECVGYQKNAHRYQPL